MPGAAVEGADRTTGVAEARAVRLPVATLAVVAALVVALLAIWATTVLGATRLPTDAPRDPPAGDPAAVGFTVSTDQRQVSLEEFGVTLAGPPFTCEKADQPPSLAIPQLVACSYAVHLNYDGTGHSWYATTGVALLDDSVAKPSLADTAEAAFTALYDISYSADVHPQAVERSHDPVHVQAPDGSAATYSAKVEVAHKGLATPYDKLVVVVLKLQSGKVVAFFSDFPHDGPRDALDAVTASVGTVSVRR